MRLIIKEFGLILFYSRLETMNPNPYPNNIENRVMNFHSKKTELICISVLSIGEEIESRTAVGTCWSVYEVKFAIRTPTNAKPRRISITIALSDCPSGFNC
jgi:hypothetical protein